MIPSRVVVRDRDIGRSAACSISVSQGVQSKGFDSLINFVYKDGNA
jgi:hypothetical protein